MYNSDENTLNKLKEISDFTILDFFENSHRFNSHDPLLSQSLNFLGDEKNDGYSRFMLRNPEKVLLYDHGKIKELYLGKTPKESQIETFETPDEAFKKATGIIDRIAKTSTMPANKDFSIRKIRPKYPMLESLLND